MLDKKIKYSYMKHTTQISYRIKTIQLFIRPLGCWDLSYDIQIQRSRVEQLKSEWNVRTWYIP